MKKRHQHRPGHSGAPSGPRPATSAWRFPEPAAASLIAAAFLAILWRASFGFPWEAQLGSFQFRDLFIFPKGAAAFGHLKTMGLAAAQSFAIWGIGKAVLRAVGLRRLSDVERHAIAFALGYGVAAEAIFVLGLAGLWKGWTFGILTTVGIISGLSRVAPASAPEQDGPALRQPLLLWIPFFAAFMVWVFNLRFALVPQTFYDALVYHLGLPNLYLLSGRIIPTPANSYSGIPSLPEMINGWSMHFDGMGLSAGVIHASLPLWVAAGFFGLGARLKRPRAAILAAVAFYLSPVVMAEGFRLSVGLEWALMEFSFFAALISGLLEPDESERRRWVLLAGCFLGFSMTTKYPAWLLPCALIPLMMPTPSDDGDGIRPFRKMETVQILSVGAFITAPWIAKNVLFYGNPLYPFFHHWFQPAAHLTPDWHQIGGASQGLISHISTPFGLLNWLVHPWNFLCPIEDVTESIGLLPIALLPLVVLRRPSNIERRMLFVAASVWIPLSMLTQSPRYFISHLGLFSFALAFFAAGLDEGPATGTLRGVVGAAALLVALSWPVLSSGQGTKLQVFSGSISQKEYLGNSRLSYPTPQFEAIDYVNANTPPDSRVLLMGDSRGMYLERSFLATTPDQEELIVVWANSAATPEQLVERFRKARISTIIFNSGDLSRRGVRFRLSAAGRRNLDAFWSSHTTRVLSIDEPPNRRFEVREVR